MGELESVLGIVMTLMGFTSDEPDTLCIHYPGSLV